MYVHTYVCAVHVCLSVSVCGSCVCLCLCACVHPRRYRCAPVSLSCPGLLGAVALFLTQRNSDALVGRTMHPRRLWTSWRVTW